MKEISPRIQVGLVINPSTYYASNGTIPMLTARNVTPFRMTDEGANKISEVSNKLLHSTQIFEKDLVIVRVGYPGATAVVPPELNGVNCASMVIVRRGKYDADYLCYLFNSEIGQSQVSNASYGSAQSCFNIGSAINFKFPVPPLAEQQTIAAALGEMDALLAAQRARLAKQRAVKQGLLQGLLSGEKRLPGFAGEWEVKRLGDIGKTYGGLTGKSKKDFEGGKAPYITFMNVMSNSVIDTRRFEFVQITLKDKQNKVLKGDLLFNTSSETPEEVGMCAVLQEEVRDLYLNSFCFGFRLGNETETNAVFLVYYLRSSFGRQLFYASAQGATRYNLSKVNFNKLSIPLPSPDEQRAIADVLTEADAHLAALEAEHAKTQLLKQGMMQNLLTGKIRLV